MQSPPFNGGARRCRSKDEHQIVRSSQDWGRNSTNAPANAPMPTMFACDRVRSNGQASTSPASKPPRYPVLRYAAICVPVGLSARKLRRARVPPCSWPRCHRRSPCTTRLG
jgi:hypothetical protein